MATITDELIGFGFQPNPETVIVKVDFSDRPEEELRGVVKVDQEKPIAPMFNYVALEVSGKVIREPHGRVYSTVVAYVERIEGNSYRVSRLAKTEIPLAGAAGYSFAPSCGLFELDSDYMLIPESLIMEPFTPASPYGFAINNPLFHMLEKEQVALAVMNVLWIFQTLDENIELDLVSPGRKATKRAVKANTKLPSPYVILKPKEAKKSYAVKEKGTFETAHKKALHNVRGHFRRVYDHPRIPAGIYFIQPHLRGTAEKGDMRRDYRVVLPESVTSK